MSISAEDLFLSIWQSRIGDEIDESDGAFVPGSPEWSKNKKLATKQWIFIWMECKELASQIRSFDEISSKALSDIKHEHIELEIANELSTVEE